MADTHYHQLLRIAVLVCTCILVFQSGILSSTTARMALETQRYVANSVGMSARVESTQLSEWTAALTTKERDLALREQALAAREIEVTLSAGQSAQTAPYTTFLLSTVLFILLVLIILNYVLDYLRSREEKIYPTTELQAE